jgi:hypothetical protein
MEIAFKFIRIFIWWLLFDTAAAAGATHSPFLLGVAIAGMTYWYWRYPLFKKNKEEQED